MLFIYFFVDVILLCSSIVCYGKLTSVLVMPTN